MGYTLESVRCGLESMVYAWAMGYGPWALGHGRWAMGHGPWAVGCGLWAVGHGPWAMGHGHGLWAVGFRLHLYKAVHNTEAHDLHIESVALLISIVIRCSHAGSDRDLSKRQGIACDILVIENNI